MKSEKIIEIKNVTKEYDGKQVVKNESFSINKGEFVTFLGPSGCGKTTTLRMIAGFEEPTSGSILFKGKDITKIPPHERPVNTVFQRYALFPHLNVFNNIAFGLKMKRIPDAIFIVDPKKERICIQEAHTLGIPLIGICDTNCDPEELDYVIPGNDDAIRAVKLIVSKMADAVIEANQGATGEEEFVEEAVEEAVEE